MLLAQRLLPLAALALATPQLSAQVLVVDDDGGVGVDHLEIADAVAAATDGGIVLVNSGQYGPFAVVGKSLTVIAATDALVRVDGQIEVRDVAAGQLVVLRGLDTGLSMAHGLLAENCAGSLRVEECELVGAEPPPLTVGSTGHGALVLDCDDVWFVRSRLRGGSGGALESFFGLPGPASAGLLVERSTLALADCVATGGSGADAIDFTEFDGGEGTAGLDAYASRIWVSGLTAIGGAGGDANEDFKRSVGLVCGDAGDGGDGILLRSFSIDGSQGPAPTTIDVRALNATPGAGGTPTCGSFGVAGVALDAGDGSVPHAVVQHPGGARIVFASSPAVGGGTLDLWSRGSAGDLSLCAIGAPGPMLELPGQVLPLSTASTLLVLDLGTIPPSGFDQATFALGPFAPGFAGATLHLQGVVVPSGTLTLELAPAGTLTLLP